MPGLDDLVRRWRFRRNAAATVALCDALTDAAAGRGSDADPALIEEVGRFASVLAPPEVRVLVAAGRMRLASGDTEEAVDLLVRAEDLEPSPDLVRLIAEARLRRGDAEGAALAFERCIQGGVNDADTLALQACAQTLARAGSAHGTDAVAREVERALGAPGSRYRLPQPRIAATVPRPPPATDQDVTVQGEPDRGLLKAAGAPADATIRQPLDEVLAMAAGSRRSAGPLESPETDQTVRSALSAQDPAAKAALASDDSLAIPASKRGAPAAGGPWAQYQQPREVSGDERARSNAGAKYGLRHLIAAFAVGVAVGAAILYLVGVSQVSSGPSGPVSPASPSVSARPSRPAPR